MAAGPDGVIRRLLGVDDLWKTHARPTPLDFDAVRAAMAGFVPADPASLAFDQTVWDLSMTVHVFLERLAAASAKALSERLLEHHKADAACALSFDKDDEPSLNFVTAAANLRARCFHIAARSRFDVKQMAGNIIPAIATTNAIVAGMIMMLAFKVLAGAIGACKNTFVQYGGERTHLLSSEPFAPPSADCSVCSVGSFVLRINTATATLRDVVDKVVASGTFGAGSGRDGLGLCGEITVQSNAGLIHDVEFDDNLGMRLDELGIRHGSKLSITNEDDADASRNVAVALFIEHWDTAAGAEFELVGDRSIKPRPNHTHAAAGAHAAGAKRPVVDDAAADPKGKRPRVDDGIDAAIVLDDDADDDVAVL
ncbi:E1 ubiquitin-activating protein uba2 [Polyrhizophydium stewartii]|uniref:E1 ubiquitin-activating protein uba2 n=1 Tax=Polyrhizophydium stewartii TaxID=2732419 RepID=A0ABR4MVR9_9FUNG